MNYTKPQLPCLLKRNSYAYLFRVDAWLEEKKNMSFTYRLKLIGHIQKKTIFPTVHLIVTAHAHLDEN